MMNYFDEIHVRLEKYKVVHKNHPRIAIMKMFIWNMLFFIKVPKEALSSSSSEIPPAPIQVDSSKFNIGFILNGGIGDYIILANYIYKFRKAYLCSEMVLDVYFSRNRDAVDSLFGNDIVDHKYMISNQEIYSNDIHRKYDLFLDMDRYPNITNRNIEKINRFQPKLLDFMLAIEKFQMKNPRLFNNRPSFDGQSAMLSIINDIKRIQQPDISNLLEIKEEFEYPIPFCSNTMEILQEWELTDKKYIVIVSGADSNCGGMKSNKVWPAYYYDDLLTRIKEAYPEISLVQLGSNSEDYSFKCIDLNLMGKTTFEQTKVLLKHAFLLIGNEGGMVHLRHALHGGKSIVIFGPTNEDFFGYSENTNLRGPGCSQACEWLYDNWQLKCKNKTHFACMFSVTPIRVMQEVNKYIEGMNLS